jgi:fructokinase
MLFGAIEAGGTKFVCAVGSGPDDLRAIERFPTISPDETIQRAIDFFRRQESTHGPLAALGIASFGPIDLHRSSPTYGFITSTPKPDWAQTDFANRVSRALDLPVGFDTDVNAAALAEWHWGAGRGLGSVLYLTIGTGIGGGAVIHGQPLHGLLHPEMGHIRIPHDRAVDPFGGACPFHGDCLEGLACGPAIEQRWGRPAAEWPVDHPAWALEAEYLSLALTNFICTLSPQRIIIGGGIMQQRQLFPLIHRRLPELLADYVQTPQTTSDLAGYVVPPELGSRSGVLGGLALASRAAKQSS